MANMFEVINDNNHIFIDDNHKNLILTRKLDKTVLIETSSAMGYIYELTLHNKEWCFAVREADNKYIAYSMFYNSTLKKISILFFASDGSITRVSNGLEIYVFGEPDTTSSNHLIGMELYNNSGEVVFSTKYKYMRVLDFCDELGTKTKQIADKTLAICNFISWQNDNQVWSPPFLETYVANSMGYLHGHSYGTAEFNSTDDVDTGVYEGNAYPSYDRTVGRVCYMLLDVTGY